MERLIIKRIEGLENKLDLLFELIQNNKNVLIEKESEYSLFSWINEWYEIYKTPKLKESSLREIRICIEKHIKLNIENKPLNKISGLDIQRALNKIKYSRTKKYTYNVYNGAFKQAIKLGIITKNPMQSVDSVLHRYKKGKALTKEQQAYFVKIIKGHKLEAFYIFLLLSGCRRGEAVSLCWSDIDYKNKLIYVRGTKTENSNRVIPLFEPLEKTLKVLSKKNDTIFNTTTNAVNCSFKRLKAHYKLNFRLHDLRHTFATRCLENGISLKTIQKWLGHSRLETTNNIYAHIMTEFEQEEVKKFNLKMQV